MTSHSEYAGLIRGYSETISAALGPVDAGMVRDSIVNNARHLHDEHGQKLLGLSRESGGYWTQASASATAFQLLDDLTPQSVPLHVRSDTGNSFLVVLRCKVSISVAGTATFRIALVPHGGSIVAPYYDASTPSVCEFTTTNTTGENVTPASLYLTPAMVGASIATYPSLRGDGSLGSARMFMATIGVWAKSSAGAPRLHGIEAREYVGA
jgi:hypothetical protein